MGSPGSAEERAGGEQLGHHCPLAGTRQSVWEEQDGGGLETRRAWYEQTESLRPVEGPETLTQQASPAVSPTCSRHCPAGMEGCGPQTAEPPGVSIAPPVWACSGVPRGGSCQEALWGPGCYLCRSQPSPLLSGRQARPLPAAPANTGALVSSVSAGRSPFSLLWGPREGGLGLIASSLSAVGTASR